MRILSDSKVILTSILGVAGVNPKDSNCSLSIPLEFADIFDA